MNTGDEHTRVKNRAKELVREGYSDAYCIVG